MEVEKEFQQERVLGGMSYRFLEDENFRCFVSIRPYISEMNSVLIFLPLTHKQLVRRSASIISVLPGRASAVLCNHSKHAIILQQLFTWYLMIITEISVTRIPAIKI